MFRKFLFTYGESLGHNRISFNEFFYEKVQSICKLLSVSVILVKRISYINMQPFLVIKRMVEDKYIHKSARKCHTFTKSFLVINTVLVRLSLFKNWFVYHFVNWQDDRIQI